MPKRPSRALDSAPVPPGLRVTHLQHEDHRFVVFSFCILPATTLSDAERSVVEGVLCGKSNAAIAAERGSKPRTVANQLAHAYAKLGVGSRQELAALCAKLGPTWPRSAR